jgi:hypothetical protein
MTCVESLFGMTSRTAAFLETDGSTGLITYWPGKMGETVESVVLLGGDIWGVWSRSTGDIMDLLVMDMTLVLHER